jgi:class 3 adenylate cyclase
MLSSLRTKLVLIMSIVVAGGTIGTSVVTQGYVRQLYQRKFEEDFKAEVRYFSSLQFGRLAEIRRHCRELARSPDMIEAVRKGDDKAIRPAVLQELKSYYPQPGEPPPGAARIGPGFLRGGSNRSQGRLDSLALREVDRPNVGVVNADGDIICMLDPEGKNLPLDEAVSNFARRANWPTSKTKENQRAQFRSALKRLTSGMGDEQEIAYAMAKGFDNKPHLREMIVTPVLAKGESNPIGAVIVSVLTSDLGERALHSFSQQTENGGKKSKDHDDQAISSGFWLDGKLHTETIPESVRDTVATEVTKRIEAGLGDAGFSDITLPLTIKGETTLHKLLYRVLNPDSPFSPACQVALYSLKTELAEEANLRTKIIQIGVLAFGAALVLILILTRGLVRPIRKLVAVTEDIRQGNYDVQVEASGRDEIGQLARSFNEMAEGLRLNRKYQRLLSQVADRMVAQQLIHNEAALGGELREVSVLFCDIRGFTSLTAGMAPDEIIALLNEHMTALTSIVHEHCGVVDKFVGDKVMALFGAPSTHGDDALRAAECALRMIQVRDGLNANGRWTIQIGIGIATGKVVAGCMGSEERLDYTVLGERVNLASRLCGQAWEGTILIDDTTKEKLGDTAMVESLPNMELRGFPERVQAYVLHGPHSHETPTTNETLREEGLTMLKPAPVV